ncbi:MAG: ATP-dependent DNA helicase RecG [Candidatus Hydrogenedens sp.]|jgi:ATP-dependent DNA helicase RecG|nr:ATP-dependent DNA helicase RecG [Candidatus Hydrogenedens sp.]
MNKIELIELIGRGEDSRTQFKQSQNLSNAKSLGGEMAAFANGKGGQILIGVDDNGSITGLSLEDVRRINQLISNTATDCVRPSINPQTDNISIDGKLVMVVTIAEGISKPYADNDGVFWVKSGADKRRVTAREEIQRMLQNSSLVHADEILIERSSLDDIDLMYFGPFFEKNYGNTLEGFCESEGISFGQLLNNLGLAQNETLNLAGLMLFGKNPQRYRPAFVVKAVSFLGNDCSGDEYRDSQDITGCLKVLYTETISFLTRNLRRVQNGQNFNTEGILEVNRSALEELVVNALLHRDYFVSAPWRMFIFENRIEIISPGHLPNNLSLENIRNGVSNIRNPLIASFATKQLPYRGIGTGIRRALEKTPDLELESDYDRNLFIARIPRRDTT